MFVNVYNIDINIAELEDVKKMRCVLGVGMEYKVDQKWCNMELSNWWKIS